MLADADCYGAKGRLGGIDIPFNPSKSGLMKHASLAISVCCLAALSTSSSNAALKVCPGPSKHWEGNRWEAIAQVMGDLVDDLTAKLQERGLGLLRSNLAAAQEDCEAVCPLGLPQLLGP